MGTIHRVESLGAAAALANLLNGGSRTKPVVVVTSPSGQDAPWIDVEDIASEGGSLAEVYHLPTGECTWEFSQHMAPGTQVYGGAGRVYPVGHEWASNLAKSPLRFAFNAADGKPATRRLISDMLSMAAEAGLLRSLPTRHVTAVDGRVNMVVAGRALVDIGRPFPATIAEELTVPGIPIERITALGQSVQGLYDDQSRRLNVRPTLRTAAEGLAQYQVGDVVLTRVAMVRNGKAELVLYPQTTTPELRVSVLRADVTGNPADDLRTLMTVGEALPARVTSTGPRWALRLDDIDDDEPVLDAPSLLPHGPPWIMAEEESTSVDEPPPLLHPLPPPLPPPSRPDPAPEPVSRQQPTTPVAPPVRPSPALLDRSRPRPTTPATLSPAPPQPTPTQPTAPHPSTVAPAPSTRALLLKIDGLTARLRTATKENVSLRAQLHSGSAEREQLRFLLAQAEREANRAEHELKQARARLRKATSARSTAPITEVPRFADAEQGFRYLVLTRWATRTLPGEQVERSLPPYRIGAQFLSSLEQLEGITEVKVADVVFEIVTGLAAMNPSRQVHRLRTGTGGDDPVRVRDDGAVAWRASLQVNSPSARRLHYWVLPNGEVELARAVTHDDMTI